MNLSCLLEWMFLVNGKHRIETDFQFLEETQTSTSSDISYNEDEE